MHSSNSPKGSLEDLFRHHLLESEAAAVAPRPQVWEQIDNSLLLAQNEKYRRRLAAYRWAVAASLLLASLAGGGWWHSQRQAPAAGTLAQATTQPSYQQELIRHGATGSSVASKHSTSRAILATTPANPVSSSSAAYPSAIDQTTTTLASAQPASINAPAAGWLRRTTSTEQLAVALGSQVAGRRKTADYALPSNSLTSSSARREKLPLQSTTVDNVPAIYSPATSSALAAIATPTPANSPSLAEENTSLLAANLNSADITAETTLATRRASLLQPTASLPATLAEVALAPGPPLELTRPWQYGASYSASAYNPNIEWAKSPILPAANSVVSYPANFSRSVAAEYRDNLRPGLGQRLSIWAARRLGNGRWSLRTGAELTQNTAVSASSVAFIGEPVADLSYLSANSARSLQRTSYRYRSVSVPAELRYANPLKTGFSLYGRIGALVTALLNVRSEVSSTPEATHTYSIGSANTPYRRVSAGLRGGAGMQYRPAGHQWSLNFGPVVEMGLLSLDANPNQNFWNQQRPYSFGLEAGMEIGRGFRLQ